MGITIRSKNLNADLGYGGFNRFRQKVADLTSKEFSDHYERLEDVYRIPDEKKQLLFFEEYEKKISDLIKQGVVSEGIVNFCYLPDCDGEINQENAIDVYSVLESHNEDIAYGYIAHPDCATFNDLKSIIRDCAENGGNIIWY